MKKQEKEGMIKRDDKRKVGKTESESKSNGPGLSVLWEWYSPSWQ